MTAQELHRKFSETHGISTDTRHIIPGTIFFALRGPNFNANAFAAEALQKGARYAIVDQKEYATSDRHILVGDGLTALQQLARYHRDQLRIPIIGLTGSNGKTTTKELLSAVLSRKFKTVSTAGNLNNHIGVPLTILSIDSSDEIAVVELGANHLGEIADLCEIANPTHGLITNIGKAHVGTFGGFENVLRGKSELYQHLLAHHGIVFVNAQNEMLVNMSKRFAAPVLYPGPHDYYHCELVSADPYIKIKTEDGGTLQTRLMGAYNFENMAAALCIGKYFGVDAALANEAIAGYAPGNMRSQVITRGSNTIILDAYNANPSSMEAAIENMARMKAGKKVVILGDMFELEHEAALEHERLGEMLKPLDFDRIYLCGHMIKSAAKVLSKALYFEQKEMLIAALKQDPVTHATILIKGSRGMGLEVLVDYL